MTTVDMTVEVFDYPFGADGLKEVVVHGPPGDLCCVYKLNPAYANRPTKGLCWGPFDSDGVYRFIADINEQENIEIHHKEPSAAPFLEAHWHENTEQ